MLFLTSCGKQRTILCDLDLGLFLSKINKLIKAIFISFVLVVFWIFDNAVYSIHQKNS